MVSLSLSYRSSRSSIHSSSSQNGLNPTSPAPSSPTPSSSQASHSGSSSSGSLNAADEENVTINANPTLYKSKGKERSHEDLRLLAVSSRLTEISYSISDIQTRIFEIQELRHKSQSSGDAANASSVIDQSLSQLDERLETVAQGIKSIDESLEPLLRRSDEAYEVASEERAEHAMILRKHAAVVAEWDASQKDIQVLREELKEDKWLTVFRTVTEQADGMMTSLEKAVNRCQDFMFQMQRRGNDDAASFSSSTSSLRSDQPTRHQEMFTSLLESYEAKKKHYMPATTKVLSIIDKGVQDRVTKNGECLRRHADSTKRWRNLRDRIARTDAEMETLRQMLMGELTPSETSSSASGTTSQSKDGYLGTSPGNSRTSKSRTNSSANTLARSISPFRKFARRITKSSSSKDRSPGTGSETLSPYVSPAAPPLMHRTPSSEPVRTLRHRSSMLNFLSSQPVTPSTPSHKHSLSLTPETSPSAHKAELNSSTLKGRPVWNSSTKVESEDRGGTVKSPTHRRVSAPLYRYSEDIPPLPSLNGPYMRSVSRSSVASSRPWSPVTSSVSTAHSSIMGVSMYRPPSRTQTPGLPTSPRNRPKTPSHIPVPAMHFRSMSTEPQDWEDRSPTTSLMQRAFSPTRTVSMDRAQTPGSGPTPPRPPSRSMIPIPSVHVSSASRPSSAMSNYRPDSAMSFRGAAARAQTPERLLRSAGTPRPSILHSRAPPSSFRDAPAPRTPGSGSRPSSRAGAATPSLDGKGPLHVYVAHPKDPLDAEVAAIVNSISHGLLVERIDPPLRGSPRENEEIRAQYAFSNAIARKVVTCKLTTLARSSAKGRDGVTKKVMVRVGGGWQDLHIYVMNRQSGV
ncbi:hypothetical protein CERSUDRAFT_112643 [Gelatoporia subvermispora B]|uniref:GAR domain-containing protein n=1 Tax=Ceriporiopsis subvermispora (strain B) TaxID=914234 RepID=M2R345_CERS8|nr:hypothetical protein CERSUDRAFT_112643 [Gelatoporia subvermispora B]